MLKIVVVDDEEQVANEITTILAGEGYNVASFTNAGHASKMIDAVGDIDLILTDMRMPGSMDGMWLLNFSKKLKRPVPVIIFTGQGDIDTAVDVMKNGAVDFLCKPLQYAELILRVKQCLEKQGLEKELLRLRKKLDANISFQTLIGKSKKMSHVYELIQAVAHTDAHVLIIGETGTGKEMVAKTIHQISLRKNDPYIAIDCSVLQPTLFESELFGCEKGAFTGAYTSRAGKLEAAKSGTVLLDEIGNIPIDIQAKLLRVIEEKEFERVGSTKKIRLCARLIAATNVDLDKAVKEGRFRQDLYYRLNVVRIALPPLRERDDDIILLANHFLDFYCKHHDKHIEGFSPEAVEQLLKHSWPGNIRELKNVIERTALTSRKKWIHGIPGLDITALNPSSTDSLPTRFNYMEARKKILDNLERVYLATYLGDEDSNLDKVAQRMGVSTRTINRMLKKHELEGRRTVAPCFSDDDTFGSNGCGSC
ncbi:MAG: sigma-54-dependent Fis family transcriptional regulator [Deltaproteobacteria bacterium]|nr:sigma-54-dependent Fis family transcriptional regulator [Deltaproteobacteria bacterium]